MKNITAVLLLVVLTTFLTGCDENRGKVTHTVDDDSNFLKKHSVGITKILKNNTAEDLAVSLLDDSSLKEGSKSKYYYSLYFLLLSLSHLYPDNCALYTLRGYVAKQENMISKEIFNAEIVEKFKPKDWSAQLLLAHSYYQKWNDKKALKHLNAAEEDLCVSSKKCKSGNRKKLLHVIQHLKKKIRSDMTQEKYTHIKMPVSNKKKCYFIGVNEKEDETVTWSGKCKNGLANGPGTLHYSLSGNEIKINMEKGKMTGQALVIFGKESKSERPFAKGILENGEYRGRWKFYDPQGGLWRNVYYNKEGKAEGAVFEYKKDKKIAYNYYFKNDRPTRSSTVICDVGKENSYEISPTIYRFINKDGYVFQTNCHYTPKKRKKIKTGRERMDAFFPEENTMIEAIDFFEESNCSVENGMRFVLNALKSGICYYFGEPETCRKKCNKGNNMACDVLGQMYLEGRGVSENVKKAFSLFSESCDRGNGHACYMEAFMFKNGTGVQKNDEKAASLFKKACADGVPGGCRFLGDVYLTGDGFPENTGKAFQAYSKACSIGDVKGCEYLCRRYYKGMKEVPPDYQKSAEYCKQACDGGNAKCCGLMGYFYYNGKGVETDVNKAFLFSLRGCALGFGDACLNIAGMYRNGSAVEKDYHKSLKWYKKSCDLGCSEGCNEHDKLQKILNKSN